MILTCMSHHLNGKLYLTKQILSLHSTADRSKQKEKNITFSKKIVIFFHIKQKRIPNAIPEILLNVQLVNIAYHSNVICVLNDSNLSWEVQLQTVLKELSKYIYVMCRI